MKNIIKERNKLLKEKNEIFKLIGNCNEPINDKKLDILLKEHLQSTNGDLVVILENVKDKDEQLYRLKGLFLQAQQEKNSKLINENEIIDHLNNQLAVERENKLELEKEEERLKDELEQFQSRLNELSKKSQLIERTRRIGYIPKLDKTKLEEISEERYFSRTSTYSSQSTSTHSTSSLNNSRRSKLNFKKSQEFGEMLFED